MRRLPSGTKITFVVAGAFTFVVAHYKITKTGYCRSRSDGGFRAFEQTYRGADEGVTWCRGWRGPDVDALRAAEALRTSDALS